MAFRSKHYPSASLHLLDTRSNDLTPLYQGLQNNFEKACRAQDLQRLAMVANGKTPLVRHSQVNVSEDNAELQKISFDTSTDDTQLLSFWQADNLVEMANFIVVAGKTDQTDVGYGYFMNRVESALHDFTKSLHLREQRDDVIVRFYQHISYIL